MTRDEIKAHLDAWLAADLAITKGKAYTIDGLTYTRQDAAAVRDQIAYWQNRLNALLNAGSGRSSVSVRPAVCLDRWCGRRCR